MDNETKKQKFVRLAEARTQSAINEIRKIGNLSNRGAYEYSEDDVRKIVKALRDAVTNVERQFSPKGPEAPFSLGDDA